ncbi:hypothetical protein [Vibrio hepatarius]|uniref:hypothetical protein n=1 Tax=Vibrio hepatarius TaxID=171383 RepID=UPI001C0829E2|nr:hypothetical protein [Vibrio hepatarius]MBU2898031.1 hypothetical protein [Vibrio hepatarius]
MSDDVEYCPAISIYDENVKATHPSHLPCASMEGIVNYDPKNAERGQVYIQNLRAHFGLKRSSQKEKKIGSHLNYICTHDECLDPWNIKHRQPKSKTKPKEKVDDNWRTKLSIKANNLPSRAIQRQEHHEATQ